MTTTKQELETILKIITRADAEGLLMFNRQSLMMDLRHVNEASPLKLEELYKSDDVNFTHDIVGIQKNFNRETKQLENFFTPRYLA